MSNMLTLYSFEFYACSMYNVNCPCTLESSVSHQVILYKKQLAVQLCLDFLLEIKKWFYNNKQVVNFIYICTFSKKVKFLIQEFTN